LSVINHLRYTHVEPSVLSILNTVRLPLYPFKQTLYHRLVMSSPSQQQTDRAARGRFAPGNKLGRRFQPGQSGNPGGLPKGTPRVDVAYKKLLALSPAEAEIYQPKNMAEFMAMEQLRRACNWKEKSTLGYAQEVTNRTDGPIVRRVEKVDLNALEAEHERFECAIGALMDKRGCTRSDAAVVLATVNPTFKKFIEVSDDSL
jgi:hypothetical protein